MQQAPYCWISVRDTWLVLKPTVFMWPRISCEEGYKLIVIMMADSRSIEWHQISTFKKHTSMSHLANWQNKLFWPSSTYLYSSSSRYRSSRKAWTTPSPCLRSRWHVCSPTPSSAPSPDATPEGRSTGTIQTLTSLGNVRLWWIQKWSIVADAAVKSFHEGALLYMLSSWIIPSSGHLAILCSTCTFLWQFYQN